MIVVTGALGFIGSVLARKLRGAEIVAVDNFHDEERKNRLRDVPNLTRVDRRHFLAWLDKHHAAVDFIFHLGARTDTIEFDRELLRALNTDYTKAIWQRCVRYDLPLVYASSAATYGAGTLGFNDDEDHLDSLTPLNPYGDSKHHFDTWALKQEQRPPFWAGLKFFNVFGPNENHKGRMASVIWHAYHQINTTHKIQLFRSYNSQFENGRQERDFIYVEDIVDVCLHMAHHRPASGIYNVGSGKARSFCDLAQALFRVCGKPEAIEFIDMPEKMRHTYQYFTRANVDKLRNAGYTREFYTLEDGIADYVDNYLKHNRAYGNN
ncbi:ADP-glyceromanno-heptose 6-epimerase [Chryseolinea lacunae]|uniref:ADP-glyceromanno-heptose 6-epimerase n=1 Tax=Chryseolinea lacunae TaxID=2801331 RepID=A0ABS1KV06_9BACT|nr:ADP-glyceromanno-heptose 6-epimerase [Chryseolinea lacunae]MBL0743052.1 ADP-glyceromanno-heptose 6-epimerase [Chryseolinea lacunae]